MFRFRLTIDIAAPTQRVWRALCDPAEVPLWDANVDRALDAPSDYPRPGQRVLWRLRSGDTLVDEPQVVLPQRALRSLLRIGWLRIDETYALAALLAGTRLDLEVEVRSLLPFLDFLYGPSTRRDFAGSLEALKRLCESSP